MNEDYSKYKIYPNKVLSGEIPACQYIKQASRRYLSWFERDDIEFRPDAADRPVNFIQKLKQYQGKWAGQYLILEEWQKFFLYGIYSWYYKGTNKRVVRHARLEISRKNGKSTLIAGLALYHLIAEGKGASEVDIVALTRQQSKILFDMCSAISKRMDPGNKHIHQTINRVKYPKYDSFIQVLASESAAIDGYSSSVAVMDEGHNQKDSKLFDVLLSSQAARENPLSILITSAGFLLNGFYYQDVRPNVINMLNGIVEQDSLFGLIYTLDEGDSIEDDSVWVKANPNLGVSVSVDYLRDRISMIKSQPSSLIDVKTKNFDIWCQSAEVWIPDSYIMKSFQKIDLSKLKGEECFGGIDLASVSDLTAVSIMFPPNENRDYFPDKFIFKSYCFLPEESIENSPNRELYKKAINVKHLLKTPGNCTDYEYILKLLLDINENTPINDIAYDSWNSTQFCISATDSGLPMTPFSQSIGNFNKCTREFERLILSDKVIIDANVMTRFCFQNATLKTDYNENAKPVKPSKDQKIDLVIAMLQSLGILLTQEHYCYYVEQ